MKPHKFEGFSCELHLETPIMNCKRCDTKAVVTNGTFIIHGSYLCRDDD